MALLLERGSNPSLPDTWGNTAWHAAASSISAAACEALPDADVQAANSDGWTAVHFAAWAGETFRFPLHDAMYTPTQLPLLLIMY